MKIVFVTEKNADYISLFELVGEKIQKAVKSEIDFLTYELQELGAYEKKLQALQPDLLVIPNLVGFELSTLTDGLFYNLLRCKQVHLLLERVPQREVYLEKALSISMFFYATDEKHAEYLEETYEGLPWLKNIAGWQDGACAELLCSVLREVLEECCMN